MLNNIPKAVDVITPDWFPKYEAKRDILYRELVTFNTRLFTLKKLDAFPFSLFLPFYGDRIFWQTVRNALIESIINISWRIVIDTDSNILTLRSFKNDIFQHLRSDTKSKQILGRMIKLVDFEKQIASLEKKVTYIRHNFIAHLNEENQTNPEPQILINFTIRQADLETLLNTSRDLFNVLCFGEYHELWLWDYSEIVRSDSRTDIDRMLDSIARNSPVLNLPETDPELWKKHFIESSPTRIDMFNAYRIKFGLAKINFFNNPEDDLSTDA